MQQKRNKNPSCINKPLIIPQVICSLALYRQVYLVIIIIIIIITHNELRDLEADLLSMVCNDFEIEPQLQDVTGEQLSSGSNSAKEARLDTHARDFWEQHQSAFFDFRVCHPNAESYKQL